MTRYLRVASLIAGLAGCHGGGGAQPDGRASDAPTIDAPVAPAFRTPRPDLTNDQVALMSLQMLGAQVSGADRNCNQCHGLTNDHFREWLQLANAATSSCLTDFAVTDPNKARAMIACLRSDPQNPSSPFDPGALGFYATAADLAWFDYLFHLALPNTADTDYATFVSYVQMPRGSHAKLTQAQFDVLAEWVARGLPLLDTYIPPTTGGPCTKSITQAVADHVTTLATTGWQAVNAGNGLNMFGCAGATSTRACLTTYPDAASTTYGAQWEQDFLGGTIRVLRTNSYSSSYWTRSSADGRFVAHGGASSAGGNSTIIDLQTDHLIATDAFYDPGFFPDNSGFAFQANQPHVCDQRLLSGTPQPTHITFAEPQCAIAADVGLYQHIGRALNNGDYWTVSGEFVSDDGGHDTTLGDTDAYFDGQSSIQLTPLVFNGTTYVQKPVISVAVPGEGDTVMSPSASWLISRVAGAGGAQNGYTLRKLVATPSGSTYTVQTPSVGRYCVTGEKPSFSFDERWLVFHHYVTDADAIDLGYTGPSDPAFQAYRSKGASNIYLVDMLTGDKTRVTRMAPGQYALYPHFRSDGWVYFLVRVANTHTEYVAASDAELVASGH